jgi:hypothetical protein
VRPGTTPSRILLQRLLVRRRQLRHLCAARIDHDQKRRCDGAIGMHAGQEKMETETRSTVAGVALCAAR